VSQVMQMKASMLSMLASKLQNLAVIVSEFVDFRFACAIGQKNIRKDYTQKVITSLGLSA